MSKNDTQYKRVVFTRDEFNALAYSIKARLASIEKRAYLEYSGVAIRQYLANDWEYTSLIFLADKFGID